MVARVRTVAFEGVDVRPVDAQVQVSGGMPAFTEMRPIAPLIRTIACVGSLAIVFAAISMPIAGTGGAQAASFDCGKATEPLEKTICADPGLSKLDEEIAKAHDEASTRLSSDGRSILREEQDAWLAVVGTNCMASSSESAAGCLLSEFEERLRHLRNAVSKLGPYVFLHVDRLFLARSPKGDRNGSRGGFVFAEIRYPQIDSPQTAETSRWNKFVKAWAENGKSYVSDWGCGLPADDDCPPDTDWATDFKLISAQPNSISMSYGVWWFWHGGAHGDGVSLKSNYILSTGKELDGSDLFIRNSDWESVIYPFIQAVIRKEKPELTLSKDDIADLIWTWTATEDAMLVEVNLRDSIAYAFGFVEVTVPWRDLKPYLRPDLPIALKLD
jgi:uncharacterized protein